MSRIFGLPLFISVILILSLTMQNIFKNTCQPKNNAGDINFIVEAIGQDYS